MRTRLFVAALFTAALAACNSSSSSAPAVVATAAPTATPTATPTANAAQTGQVSGSPISHVIVVVQENRTVDNLFGLSLLSGGTAAYPGADAANTVGGTKMRVGSFTEPYDPSHSHASLVAEWDGGKMDGFAADPVSSANGGATPPPGYVYMNVNPNETLAYHLLAQRYALADRMFSSRLVPSFPGHQFLIAGQGPADSPTDNAVWGCDSKSGSTALAFSTGESVSSPGTTPCYDYQTLGDLLDAKSVSWKYYTGAIGTIDGLNSAYDAINHIRYGVDWTRNIVSPVTQILNDVQNCTLPAVSYVTPPALASDHAGSFTAAGPGWVGSIYLQIAQTAALSSPACQYYTNTAILVTWDDAGGWYDHVVPPTDAQGNSYGFRVPLIAISAFAQSGYSAANANAPPYVSHTVRDFGAILRFIEKNWGLGSLGTRDAGADDLSDMFNYAGSPIPPIGATLQSAMRYPQSYYRNLPPATRPVDDDR